MLVYAPHIKLTLHNKFGYGKFAVKNDIPDKEVFIPKFIFWQSTPPALSVQLFIKNYPDMHDVPSGK